MPLISSDYRGPLVVVAVGAGFLLVGAVPVAVTFSIGVRTSAKVIGMGFVGFGLLLMLPGLCWCVWVRVQAFRKRHWPSSAGKHTSASGDDGTGTIVGANHDDVHTHGETTEASARRSARTRSWPSSYIDPPLLIVADNEVCKAAICTAPSGINNGGVANTAADDTTTDRPAASADQLTVSPGSTTDHPPPLRTQRSDPGPTERTSHYDQLVNKPRPLTADLGTDEAPP